MTEHAFADLGFTPLTLADKDRVASHLRADPPRTSELTFTNLFMWRGHYQPWLREQDGCLLIIMAPAGQEPFGLPPVGAGDKAKALAALFAALERVAAAPRVCRAGADFVERFVDPARYAAALDRDQSDYVYLTQDLINLSGNRFHKKKNHLNKFRKTYAHEYRPLDQGLVEAVLAMQQDWCALKDCASDLSLAGEDQAIYEALSNFGRLDYAGGAILIEGRVEAFTMGEPLNPDTVVIHIEKANPAVNGLYAAINQMFAQGAWAGYAYINREQDLGLQGLRVAKESYNPHHLVDKYVLAPA